MRIWARLLAVVGDIGFIAAVVALYRGMRDVIVQNGGFCASSGPNTLAPGHHCSGSDTELVLYGMLGVFLIGGIALAATSAAGWSPLGFGLAAWVVVFGALGYNFISLGTNPLHGSSGSGGWIVTGIVFWLMALGGAVPAVALAAEWLRRGGSPEPPPSPAFPIVRAVVNQDRPPRTGGV
ncbi:MAG TPA: hypothetical protein VHU61_17900 [Solirubrobacteraceae bacterium]|jgi:hypothetical protein|nr:hypothetical protein [Solirubrobacteraceae bacterium]